MQIQFSGLSSLQNALLNLLVALSFVAKLSAIFVALKLQLQNRTCKPAAISVRFLVQFTAAV